MGIQNLYNDLIPTSSMLYMSIIAYFLVIGRSKTASLAVKEKLFRWFFHNNASPPPPHTYKKNSPQIILFWDLLNSEEESVLLTRRSSPDPTEFFRFSVLFFYFSGQCVLKFF